jgi:hypothetical protein
MLYASVILIKRATCYAHLIPNFIILTSVTKGINYTFHFAIFLNVYVISLLLNGNILVSTSPLNIQKYVHPSVREAKFHTDMKPT